MLQAASTRLLCLASIQGTSWEPDPEHKALLLSSLVQTPRYLSPPLPQEPETASCKCLSLLWGLQSIPTVTRSTCENFQAATVSWKVNFVLCLCGCHALALTHPGGSSLTHSLCNGFLSPCCVLYLPSSGRHRDLREADPGKHGRQRQSPEQ